MGSGGVGWEWGATLSIAAVEGIAEKSERTVPSAWSP